jgi:hypothetical protein
VTGPSVSLLAADAGYYPAIFVHDWAATLFTVAWLFGFLGIRAALDPGLSTRRGLNRDRPE